MASAQFPATTPTAASARRRGLGWFAGLCYLAMLLCTAGLAITGIGTLIAGASPMRGWILMLHCTVAPGFAICITLAALMLADRCRFGAAGCYRGMSSFFFWAMLLTGLVVILSAVLPMTPIPSQEGQHLLYQTHRFGSVVFTVAAILHAVSLLRGPKAD